MLKRKIIARARRERLAHFEAVAPKKAKPKRMRLTKEEKATWSKNFWKEYDRSLKEGIDPPLEPRSTWCTGGTAKKTIFDAKWRG